MSWPLTGLLTDAPGRRARGRRSSVIAIAVWRGAFGRPRERAAARWLGLGLLWTALSLTFISPSLATVVPGLPNDHYHAFADPMVFTLLGLGAAVLWRAGGARRAGMGARPRGPARRPPRRAAVDGRTVGRVVAVVGVAALVGWNVARPAAGGRIRTAASRPRTPRPRRIVTASGGAGLTLRSLPDFKSTEAYAYPLVRSAPASRRTAAAGR